MKTLSQQGALLELQAWLEAGESRVGLTSSSSSSSADLRELQRRCEVETSVPDLLKVFTCSLDLLM